MRVCRPHSPSSHMRPVAPGVGGGWTLPAPEPRWGSRSRLIGELTKIGNNDPIYMAETRYRASYQYVGLLDSCQQTGSPVVSSLPPARRKSLQLKHASGNWSLAWKENRVSSGVCVRVGLPGVLKRHRQVTTAHLPASGSTETCGCSLILVPWDTQRAAR